MTEIIVKVFFASGIFLLAIYYGTRFLAGKVHPPQELQEPKEVTPQIQEDLHTEVEKELFDVDQRQVVEKEPKPEFPIDKPKKKRKYYPKKKQ
jgi:hypothetical protein